MKPVATCSSQVQSTVRGTVLVPWLLPTTTRPIADPVGPMMSSLEALTLSQHMDTSMISCDHSHQAGFAFPLLLTFSIASQATLWTAPIESCSELAVDMVSGDFGVASSFMGTMIACRGYSCCRSTCMAHAALYDRI